MKRLSLYIVVFLLLAVAVNGVQAQAKAGTQPLSPPRVWLAPHEKKEAIQIPDSVMVLLTDARFTIAIPLGETCDGIIPAGTKVFVPAGQYVLENPGDIPLEFLLIRATETQMANSTPQRP